MDSQNCVIGVSQSKLDVPQLEFYFFEFPVLPPGLLVRSRNQNSNSDCGTSSLFCNTKVMRHIGQQRCMHSYKAAHFI